ncbi:hypothetical protein DFJ77DRAFT_302091 [Powellomyces hirtus]|nr:hypothetical protein DFJ77DRAFT_302091 [Powellomyces hirtus]
MDLWCILESGCCGMLRGNIVRVAFTSARNEEGATAARVEGRRRGYGMSARPLDNETLQMDGGISLNQGRFQQLCQAVLRIRERYGGKGTEGGSCAEMPVGPGFWQVACDLSGEVLHMPTGADKLPSANMLSVSPLSAVCSSLLRIQENSSMLTSSRRYSLGTRRLEGSPTHSVVVHRIRSMYLAFLPLSFRCEVPGGQYF